MWRDKAALVEEREREKKLVVSNAGEVSSTKYIFTVAAINVCVPFFTICTITNHWFLGTLSNKSVIVSMKLDDCINGIHRRRDQNSLKA